MVIMHSYQSIRGKMDTAEGRDGVELLAQELEGGQCIATHRGVCEQQSNSGRVQWHMSLAAAVASFAWTFGCSGPMRVTLSGKRVLASDSTALGLRLVLRTPRSRSWDDQPDPALHRALSDACSVLSALHGLFPPPHAIATLLARLRASIIAGVAGPLSAMLGVPHVEAAPANLWRARGLVSDLGDRSTGCAGAIAMRDGRVLASSVPTRDLRPAWLLSEPSVHGKHVFLDGGKTPCELQFFSGRHASLAVFFLRSSEHKASASVASTSACRRSAHAAASTSSHYRRSSRRIHSRKSSKRVSQQAEQRASSHDAAASNGHANDEEEQVASKSVNIVSRAQHEGDNTAVMSKHAETKDCTSKLEEENEEMRVPSDRYGKHHQIDPRRHEEQTAMREAASAATEASALETAATALEEMDEALSEENPARPWHVSGIRYLVSDSITGSERATPAKKVSTLLQETIHGLSKARNEVPRSRGSGDGEVAIRLHQDAWVVNRTVEGLTLWVVLEQGGNSLLDATQRVSTFARESLPAPQSRLLADV